MLQIKRCLMNKKEQHFVDTVWEYYKLAGRHQLPWRQTQNPYYILVSELMLQQTQVQRVIPKYQAFIKRWPTVQKLAQAPQGAVLTAWQGLGYNRRAKFLHQCAKTIVAKPAGVFPTSRKELESLPGVGPYTAGAILAFAYNTPVILIETNVRRVYLHHFFRTKDQVSDAALYPYLEKTLPPQRTKEWYSALMDYGSHLKQTISNPNQRSAHYAKQPRFKGSDREIRGAILKVLARSHLTGPQIHAQFNGFESARIDCQLLNLRNEGLVQQTGSTYSL
jgi:A/G-specific adenine glycosylase